jgi:hypothetical protein
VVEFDRYNRKTSALAARIATKAASTNTLSQWVALFTHRVQSRADVAQKGAASLQK